MSWCYVSRVSTIKYKNCKYCTRNYVAFQNLHIKQVVCSVVDYLYYKKDRLAKTMQKSQGINFHFISDKYATNV